MLLSMSDGPRELQPWDNASFGKMIEVASKLGMQTATSEQLLAETGGTGLHWKLLTRVADLHHEPWPALAARWVTVTCDYCRETCWYDPLSSVYPEGEVLVCAVCFTDPAGQEAFSAGPPAEKIRERAQREGRLPPGSPFRRR